MASNIVWTDHVNRLVMIQDATVTYKLEVKVGDVDAMGKSHYVPAELTWPIFTAILDGVAAWKPVSLNPDEIV